jgi:SAM-dependent methyltransferase
VASPGPRAQYDRFADAYAADNDANAFNDLYERPAMLALLGELAGRRVLDAGCGAGQLAEAMLDRGAEVTGVEVSAAMARLARARLGDRAAVHVADLAAPLTVCADASFDAVAASLVLHYLEDWGPTLGELRRVLRPGGLLAVSTHHPTMDWRLAGGSYFETRRITETWHKGGTATRVTFWRRPLTAMTTAFRAAGFAIEDVVEPMPLPACAERFPDDHARLTTAPRFIFFRLRRPPAP